MSRITTDQREALKKTVLDKCRKRHKRSEVGLAHDIQKNGSWPRLNFLANDVVSFLASGTAIRVAHNPIVRFFDEVNPTPNPHQNTLEALARYAGYCGGFPEFQAEFELRQQPAIAGENRPARLRQAYVELKKVRRGNPDGPAPARVLALLRTGTGMNDFAKAFVDLAYLNGYYGELVEHLVARSNSSFSLIFEHGLLFLRAWLAENEPQWREYLAKLLDEHPQDSLHHFPRGRRAFARILGTCYNEARGSSSLTEVLAAMEKQPLPGPNVAAGRELPAFYNYFPAGYHFQITEALFLAGEYDALSRWVGLTKDYLARMDYSPRQNVFCELLEAFEAVALLRTGQVEQAEAVFQGLRPSTDEDDNKWLWDYYQIHWWLSELHFASARLDVRRQQELRMAIARFARQKRMLFFERLSATIG